MGVTIQVMGEPRIAVSGKGSWIPIGGECLGVLEVVGMTLDTLPPTCKGISDRVLGRYGVATIGTDSPGPKGPGPPNNLTDRARPPNIPN